MAILAGHDLTFPCYLPAMCPRSGPRRPRWCSVSAAGLLGPRERPGNSAASYGGCFCYRTAHGRVQQRAQAASCCIQKHNA